MEKNDTSLALLKRFLNADLVERDLTKALSCLSRDVLWFGTSDS